MGYAMDNNIKQVSYEVNIGLLFDLKSSKTLMYLLNVETLRHKRRLGNFFFTLE